MGDILLERWGSDIVTGDRTAPKPSFIGFKNTVHALELLNKHIKNKSNIAVHCDVDVDGIGSGYIIKRFLGSLGVKNVLMMINKEKVHGISSRHIEYLNKVGNCDLLIVVDSSTNEIEYMKKAKLDVLVIDHHEVLADEVYGDTHKGLGKYVIVNNMIDNKDNEEINEWLRKNNPKTTERVEPYIAEDRMSGAMVLYELLRLYCEAYSTGNILENLMLYQWVGVTLFSDSVLLVPDRNQWYIENTVHSPNIEGCLQIILSELNKYKSRLDKSFIAYELAPTINRAIRDDASGKVLDVILNRPKDIGELEKHREQQDLIIQRCVPKGKVYEGSYIMKDITLTGISRNYCGVIAARLCGENNKNAVVYKLNGDIAEGSFRGRRNNVDYRRFFEEYEEGIYAQGHKVAFGFKVNIETLPKLMGELESIEPEQEEYYLTAGNLSGGDRGVHHVEDFNEFKRQGYLWRLAVANSKLSTNEHLEIITSSMEVRLVEQRGKLYIYEVLGMQAKAFEPIVTGKVSIYVEYNGNIEIYLRNVRY